MSEELEIEMVELEEDELDVVVGGGCLTLPLLG